MLIEHINMGDEVSYTAMQTLGRRLLVMEVIANFNMVRLSDKDGIYIWAKASEIIVMMPGCIDV